MQFIILAVAFVFYTGVISTASATAPDKDQASMGRGNAQSTGQGLPPPMAGANAANAASLAQPEGSGHAAGFPSPATSDGNMGAPAGLSSATLNGSSSNHGGLPGAGQVPTGPTGPGAPMFGVPNGPGYSSNGFLGSSPNKGGLPGGSTPFSAGTSTSHMPPVPGSLYAPHEGGPGYFPSGNPPLSNPYFSTSFGAGSSYPSSFGGQSGGDFYSSQSGGYSSPWTMSPNSHGGSLGMSGSPLRGSSSFPNSNSQSDSFNWNGFLPDGSHASESLALGAYGQSQAPAYAQNFPRSAPGYNSQFGPWNRQNGGSTQSFGTQGGYYGQDGNGMPAYSQLSQGGGYNGGSTQPFSNQGGYYGRGGNGMFSPSQFNQFSQTQGDNQNGGSMQSFAYPGGFYGQGGNRFSTSGQYGRDSYFSQSNPYGFSGSYGYDGSGCDSGFGGQVFRGQSMGATRGWY